MSRKLIPIPKNGDGVVEEATISCCVPKTSYLKPRDKYKPIQEERRQSTKLGRESFWNTRQGIQDRGTGSRPKQDSRILETKGGRNTRSETRITKEKQIFTTN